MIGAATAARRRPDGFRREALCEWRVLARKRLFVVRLPTRAVVAVKMTAGRVRSSRADRKRPAPRAACPVRSDCQAALTVLTGLQRGVHVALNGVPITIGRAADADLVIEDPSVGAHHTRIGRAPNGAFYAVDLSSANGTFVDADRIGIALLRDGDLLRVGPTAEMRFTITPSGRTAH